MSTYTSRKPDKVEEQEKQQEYLTQLIDRTPEDLYPRLSDIKKALDMLRKADMSLEAEMRWNEQEKKNP